MIQNISKYGSPFICHLNEIAPNIDVSLFDQKYFISSCKGEIYNTSNLNQLNRIGESFNDISQINNLNINKDRQVLILRQVDKINNTLKESIQQTAEKIAPSLQWLYQNSAGSLSGPGASLGYHADNYHVAILQVSGSRHWQVWDKDVLNKDEKRFLHRERHNEDGYLPQKPNVSPIIDSQLLPGEILWIPALYPHLGVTNSNENAFSISFVWLAPSYLKLAYYIRDSAPIPISTSIMETLLPHLYQHLPLTPNDQAKEFLKSNIKELSVQLGIKCSDVRIKDIINKIIPRH